MAHANSFMKSKPYVANYPPLDEWLKKHSGYCQWQIPLGDSSDPSAYVEAWMFPGGMIAILVVHANQNGWDIYTPSGEPRIDATLADAAGRLGLGGVAATVLRDR